MLDLALFRRPALVSATFAAFVTGAGIIALMSFLSTVLESGTSRPAVAAAAILLAWSGAVSGPRCSPAGSRCGSPVRRGWPGAC